MGRSLGSKRNTSQDSGGCVTATGSGNNFDHQYHSRDVKSLMEKLQQFRAHEDILKLDSVKAVISALEDSSSNIPPDSEVKLGSEASTSSPPGNKSIRGTKQPVDASAASCGNDIAGVTSKFTARKSQKYHVTNRSSDGGSGASDSISSSPADSQAVDKVNSAKRGFATLIRNFENLYKRVAKKYFFMLKPRKPSKSNFFGVFFSILAFIFYFELHTITGFSRLWLKWENVDLGSVECTIESPNLAMELFRPPVSCAICHNVKSADRVSGISPTEFEKVYAYTGRPVIVTDAMANWTATSAFSFDFFKGIYSEGSRSLEHLGEDCLFFPYQTEFRSLADAFNMTKERSARPWYIGWSNCDAETSHILRQHYQRPYFLPETAESTHADWIFTGTPGKGAHMHIDHVINPSWQGQIKGFKRWHLQPPPECYYECQSFHVNVQPGDIIVLDTNKWYHQTEILPGENSITIGSEYD